MLISERLADQRCVSAFGIVEGTRCRWPLSS